MIFGDESVNKECKVFPEDIHFGEDNEIASSLKLRIKRLVYIPQPVYFYFERQGSLSRSISEKHIIGRWISGHRILERAQSEGNLQQYLLEFEFIFSTLFILNTTNYVMPHIFQGKKEFLKQLITEQKRIFPNFQNNPYYQGRVAPDQRGMINLLMEIL